MTFNGVCAWCNDMWIYLKNLTLYFLALKEVGCGSVPQRCWNGEIEVNEFSQRALWQSTFFFKIVIRIHFYILVQCQYEQNIFVFFPSLNIALKLIHYSQQSSKCYFSTSTFADFYIVNLFIHISAKCHFYILSKLKIRHEQGIRESS